MTQVVAMLTNDEVDDHVDVSI